MEPDWFGETEMEEDIDDDSDDENEIRQLEAVLDEPDVKATIEITKGNVKGLPNTKSLITASPLPTSSTYSTEISQKLSQLDTTMALNKLYDEKLNRLERLLYIRLGECRNKLSKIQTSGILPERSEVFRYISCGKPYFRDSANNPAPENEDTNMAKTQMYDFSLVTSVPGWTVRDKNQFTQVMTQASLDLRKDRYNEKIAELKHQMKSCPNKGIDKEIAKLRRERDSLSIKTPFAQLALPLEEEYDWDVLANKLNKRHTPHEYKCLWKLYFHPTINKSSWKNSEHNSLQALAGAHFNQDWDEIARKLNTGRTGYQCFVYFRTNMNSTSTGKKWTPEEVTYLKRLIDYFKEDSYIPWGKISAAMENRTKIQIYNKYLRIIEQRKGRFLPEEDAVILNCVERFGPNFKRITEYLAHRSMVQIRARYHVLSKMRISTVWSPDDDRKLIQIMSDKDANMSFSAATQYFPGRNRANIRSRYVTLLKWMNKHPNLDIAHAPRRGARRLNHGQASDDLNKAIENLKNILNTEVEVKSSSKKITRDSSEREIEDAIVATLVTEGVKDQELKKYSFETSLVLPNETVVTNKELDTTNLRKCLIFLSSRLVENSYRNSLFSDQYPNLGDLNHEVSLVHVKSYSKKDKIKTIKMDDGPDIWGNSFLIPRNYVMPPHYATIIGCKALMSHVSALSMYCDAVNLHVLVRRNKQLKDQLDLLLERFYILFVWPMLLSNEGPNDFHKLKASKRDSFHIRPPMLPSVPEVTIRFDHLKKFKNVEVAENIDIDLNTDDKEPTEILLPETLNHDNVTDVKI